MSVDTEYLTVGELASLVRRSPWTIYRWKQTHYGPTAIKVGGRILYRRDEVSDWCDKAFTKAALQYGDEES